MMVRKTAFNKLGQFNENYLTCLEDVELNILCLKSGLKNLYSGKAVAYHYESQSRSEDIEINDKFKYDYHTNLVPIIMENLSKISNYIIR
jgi:GT2 family glycosyltransferase